MTITKNNVDHSRFNQAAVLPFELRLEDFQMAMRDVYDFFTYCPGAGSEWSQAARTAASSWVRR